MTAAAKTLPSLRFRGRSFLALVLQPEPPLADWLTEVDDWLKRSPGFFRGRPVVLDVGAVPLDKEGIAALVADLAERDVRLMGIEGTKGSYLGLGMPPLISGGRQADSVEVADAQPAVKAPARKEVPAVSHVREPARSLMVREPVRSGQSIFYPQGDVTVIGSVASGAEVVAGGSIHVYGVLRGRAVAGTTGNPDARIFCGKLEAELLGIDGLYRTADTLEPEFHGKPVQTWLDGKTIRITALN